MAVTVNWVGVGSWHSESLYAGMRSYMARRKGNDWLIFGKGKGYFHRVHHPLQCLVFITPLLLIYQILVR